MKLKRLARPAAVALLVLLLLQIGAPLSLRAEMKSCEAAFLACSAYAGFLGPAYALFCLEGYIFCKRYLER